MKKFKSFYSNLLVEYLALMFENSNVMSSVLDTLQKNKIYLRVEIRIFPLCRPALNKASSYFKSVRNRVYIRFGLN